MIRKADSLKPTDKIIQDPVMEPFFITKALGSGYTVYERVQKKKTQYLKTVGYPSNFNHALKMVARELLDSNETAEYESLQQYISEYKSIQEKLSSLTDF